AGRRPALLRREGLDRRRGRLADDRRARRGRPRGRARAAHARGNDARLTRLRRRGQSGGRPAREVPREARHQGATVYDLSTLSAPAHTLSEAPASPFATVPEAIEEIRR